MARDPYGDPDAAAWGAPGCVSIFPEQPPKLVLGTSEICTAQLLLQSRIPQVQYEPRAAPWVAGGAAGTTLCWAAGQHGAGGAVSSLTRTLTVPPAPADTQGFCPFLALSSALSLAESWCRQPVGRQEGELPDLCAGTAEQ